jgi:hypothetical protein
MRAEQPRQTQGGNIMAKNTSTQTEQSITDALIKESKAISLILSVTTSVATGAALLAFIVSNF